MISFPAEFSDRSVTVVGLGYVGLTLAVSLAKIGFKVYGVEKNHVVLKSLRAGRPQFFEPKLPELLSKVLGNGSLTISGRIEKNTESSVFIVTVGTPLGEDRCVRLDMVVDALSEVENAASDGSMVLLRSTLRLGTTRRVAEPILNKNGKQFCLAFCPERTVEGQALAELPMLPQIVGGIDDESTLRATNFFRFLTRSIVSVSSPETAEIIKMVDNTHRDISFAFSNEIAFACDTVGVSAIEVINAGKSGYSRTDLPLPGPVGGPCLSKDPHILNEGLKLQGARVDIAMAARGLNEELPDRVVQQICSLLTKMNSGQLPRGLTVSLLGLAFKGQPITDDLRGTMAIPFLECLKAKLPDANFKGFDPMVDHNSILGLGLSPCKDIEDAFDRCNLVLILNNHIYFQNMPLEKLAWNLERPALVYDLWSNFSSSAVTLPQDISYVSFGDLVNAV